MQTTFCWSVSRSATLMELQTFIPWPYLGMTAWLVECHCVMPKLSMLVASLGLLLI